MKTRFFCLALVAVTGALGCATTYDKYDFHIEDGGLRRGADAYALHAVAVPDLMSLVDSEDAFARALIPLAEPGATAACFDLHGFNADGTRLSNDALAMVDKVVNDAKSTHFSVLCRVLADVPEDDPELREQAVCTAARAFRGERRIVYVIDGPDAPRLAALFQQQAGDVVVAAPGDASLALTSTPDELSPDVVPLLNGVLPAGSCADSNFLLPNTAAALAALDAAMADPVEAEPWEPDPSVLTPEERADGWIALFDGKTFNGWTITGDEAGFQVRDGMLEWVKGGGDIVRTRDRYDNFILRFEWKIEDGGNSGVFLRAPRAARESRIGMEFQLQGDYGKEPTTTSTGALYDAQAPSVNASKSAGEWNTVEITLDGPHVRAVLNGVVIHDLNLDEHEKLARRLRRGFIALQDHGRYAAFRNIRLKKL